MPIWPPRTWAESQAAESLAEIRKASTRASELVRPDHGFRSPKETKHEPVDLNAVTGEVLKLLRSTLPRAYRLKTEFAEDTPHVLADAGQIHEVIVNLTPTRPTAIRPGRRVDRVSAAAGAVDEELARSIPGLKPGRYRRLTVSDTGCGMDGRDA